ncbi:MAG: hypothetical protein ACFFD4_37565 [Candidatus Odinarchaeota archaeon]
MFSEMSMLNEQLKKTIDKMDRGSRIPHRSISKTVYKNLKKVLQIDDFIIDILVEHNYSSFETLSNATVSDLVSTGINRNTSIYLINRANYHLGNSLTAEDILAIRRGRLRISTGSSDLDELFSKDGVEIGSITLFMGDYGTGKTQICHQLSVMAQLRHSSGGLRGENIDSEAVIVIFIDTGGTFRPERITSIAQDKNHDIDVSEIRTNIKVKRALSSEGMISAIDWALERAKYENVGLIAIDSLSCFSFSDRQLEKIFNSLNKATEELELVVAITDRVKSKQGSVTEDTCKKDPFSGHIAAERSQYVVLLKKAGGRSRKARLVANPVYPEKDANFMITEEGIVNDISLFSGEYDGELNQ